MSSRGEDYVCRSCRSDPFPLAVRNEGCLPTHRDEDTLTFFRATLLVTPALWRRTVGAAHLQRV